MIVRTATMVTLLGGGELDPADLDLALDRAPTLVAADSGADIALAQGRVPQAVIGDLDSLSKEGRAHIDPDSVHLISEQDSTDFDKALRSIDAPGVIAAGFTGARVDHELAVYHSLVSRPFPPCFVLGREDIVFHVQGQIALTLDPGTRVSLFPMAPVAGRSAGLRWPIDGLDFAPSKRIGTSNVAVDANVRLEFDSPGMLLILPRACLDAAIDAVVEFPLSPASPTG